MSDPNQGDFSDNAPYTQQDAATFAIYRAIMRGDFNLDGQKTSGDILQMMQALANPGAYQTANNLSDMEFLAIADVNQDGEVTNTDLQALLVCCVTAMNQLPPFRSQAVRYSRMSHCCGC
jgi:hypothetical protein